MARLMKDAVNFRHGFSADIIDDEQVEINYANAVNGWDCAMFRYVFMTIFRC